MPELQGLNREQLAAVKHGSGPLLVVAGAGTGKTQAITYRIAYLIKQLKVSPSQILGLTFTEKAAAEMSSRVSEIIKKYVLDVNITKFNSFGSDLLKRFGFDIGLKPDMRLLNQTQQLIFLRDHIDEL